MSKIHSFGPLQGETSRTRNLLRGVARLFRGRRIEGTFRATYRKHSDSAELIHRVIPIGNRNVGFLSSLRRAFMPLCCGIGAKVSPMEDAYRAVKSESGTTSLSDLSEGRIGETEVCVRPDQEPQKVLRAVEIIQATRVGEVVDATQVLHTIVEETEGEDSSTATDDASGFSALEPRKGDTAGLGLPPLLRSTSLPNLEEGQNLNLRRYKSEGDINRLEDIDDSIDWEDRASLYSNCEDRASLSSYEDQDFEDEIESDINKLDALDIDESIDWGDWDTLYSSWEDQDPEGEIEEDWDMDLRPPLLRSASLPNLMEGQNSNLRRYKSESDINKLDALDIDATWCTADLLLGNLLESPEKDYEGLGVLSMYGDTPEEDTYSVEKKIGEMRPLDYFYNVSGVSYTEE